MPSSPATASGCTLVVAGDHGGFDTSLFQSRNERDSTGLDRIGDGNQTSSLTINRHVHRRLTHGRKSGGLLTQGAWEMSPA